MATSVFRLLLQMKQKTEVCFPWSANDKQNRLLLFQQTWPSMLTVYNTSFRGLLILAHIFRLLNFKTERVFVTETKRSRVFANLKN
jgi:hypothetical protein